MRACRHTLTQVAKTGGPPWYPHKISFQVDYPAWVFCRISACVFPENPACNTGCTQSHIHTHTHSDMQSLFISVHTGKCIILCLYCAMHSTLLPTHSSVGKHIAAFFSLSSFNVGNTVCRIITIV